MSPADGEPQLLYLEPDDEITSVIRRLRGADAGRVVLVAPGRSRATSSVVALRLLQRAAVETGRSVALVADASTRSLAGEAGVAAFASVADATSPTPSPAEPMTPMRAPIHVVRGAGGARPQPARPIVATDGMEETVAVHLPPPAASGRGDRRPRGLPRWQWRVALLITALAAGAAVLPGATVTITPATTPVGPVSIPVTVDVSGHVTGQLEATKPGTATGERLEQVAATGIATFINWSLVAVEIPKGTQVSVGGTTAFSTVERFVVQRGRFNGKAIQPGQGSVGVVAVVAGSGGNVAADAIDTVDDDGVRLFLRGSPDNPNRLVRNSDPTTGGTETPHTVIQQGDVDAVVAAIKADLQAQQEARLAGEPDRLYAAAPAEELPNIDIPEGLVGTEDQGTFELRGTLTFDRAYGSQAQAEATASTTFLSGGDEVPPGTAIVADSIRVNLGPPTLAGGRLDLTASVTAAAAAMIDGAQARDRIAGLTVPEAKAQLAPLGDIAIDLWPGWVDRLPGLTFRIDIREEVQTPIESPGPSVNQ
ncbi:MAG: baseplate J/gp47 family protein [Chloroflexi bacterium]|nr:baseplate J/gp47 family protein [Chloroflexota bacterium]